MAETYVQANADGSGKKLHTFDRTIGANSVHDEVMLQGEQYLASYVITPAAGVSLATVNDHVLQIMAGASLNVYLRSLRVWQLALATTANIPRFELLRLTTAGTGGTVITPGAYDSTDGASGATAMTIPTAKGTESTRLGASTAQSIQTVGTGGAGQNPLIFEREWDWRLRTKMPRIAAGTANGLALKSLVATAAMTVIFEAIIVEANF